MPVGRSRLNLVTALKDCSKAGGASSMRRKCFIAPNLSFHQIYVCGAKNSPFSLDM